MSGASGGMEDVFASLLPLSAKRFRQFNYSREGLSIPITEPAFME